MVWAGFCVLQSESRHQACWCPGGLKNLVKQIVAHHGSFFVAFMAVSLQDLPVSSEVFGGAYQHPLQPVTLDTAGSILCKL